jgi:hypothetical protein
MCPATLKEKTTMSWDAIQQIIRIVAYAVGGYFLGDSVTSGETFGAAVGGLISIGAFVWWLVYQRTKPAT